MSEWIIMLNDYPIGFVKATQDEIAKITRHLVEKKLLAIQKKMVIHQGASFVIARKGQGFVDKYIKPKKKKTA